MADSVKIDVQGFGPAKGGDLVVFVGDDLKLADTAASRVGSAGDLIGRLAPLERFKGKAQSALSIPMPQGLPVERLIARDVEKDCPLPSRDPGPDGAAEGRPVEVFPVLLAPDPHDDQPLDRETLRHRD